MQTLNHPQILQMLNSRITLVLSQSVSNAHVTSTHMPRSTVRAVTAPNCNTAINKLHVPGTQPTTGSSYSGPKVVRAQLRVWPTTVYQVLHRPGPNRWKQAQERARIDRNRASSKRAHSLDGGEKGKRRREDVKTQQSQAMQHCTDPEDTTVRTNSRT